MSGEKEREFPRWEDLYRQQTVESMPWFNREHVSAVAGLLKDDGYLFMKCFSHQQPGERGPYRFTPEQIHDLFRTHFTLQSIKETVYQGTLDPLPLALFSILRRG